VELYGEAVGAMADCTTAGMAGGVAGTVRDSEAGNDFKVVATATSAGELMMSIDDSRTNTPCRERSMKTTKFIKI
jgi:hypothetical protein